jgi:predicted Zn-dependent protease
MRSSRALIRPALLVAALAATAAMAGCAYNEALGRNQILLVDNAALAQAADQAWQETLRKEKVSKDPEMNARVQRVSSRLVQAAGLGGQTWTYVVFEDPTPNAFALPGGKIGVNTGLFKVVKNDDQLAAVIGHEIGHNVANHAAERYSQTAAAQIGLGVAQGVAGSGDLGQAIGAYGGVGAQLGVLLPFSRKHELEADRLGVDYMHAAGYRPSEAIALWRNMAAQRTGGSQPSFMSTHPSDAQRIAELEAYIKSRGWS